MADLRRQAERNRAWWRRENTRPLVKNHYPQKLPFGGLDHEVPVDEIAERKLRNAEVLHESVGLQDSLVTAGVNFATALYPATAGAGYRFDRGTSWTIPVFSSAREVRVRRFDPDHELYREYVRRLEQVLKHWSWDTYLPVPSGYDGPFDILAGLLGSETLAMELYTAPDDVRAAAEAAAEFMCDVIDFERSLFTSAGLGEESVTPFNTLQPGFCGLFVEDFSALVGPDHYREFFLELDRRVISHLDTALFHTHSAGSKNNIEMLALPETVAFEVGNDPGGPDLDSRIETARAILANGRALIFGSWNVPLPEEEIDRTVAALPPAGLDLRFQCGSAEEARDLYDRIQAVAPTEED